MDRKKTPEADLENERTTFFLLGFIVVLATFFAALEWHTEEDMSSDWESLAGLFPAEVSSEWLTPAPEYPVNQSIAAEPELKQPEKTEKTNTVYENYTVVEQVSDSSPAAEQFFTENEKNDADLPLHEQADADWQQKMISEQVFTEAEIMPQFPGGYTELNQFIFNRLHYPASAYTQRIQGRVWCSFIVNKDGSLADIRIERGVHISLDQEALRVLYMMPPWMPGTIRGEAVRVKVYLPIVYKM